MPPIKVLKQSFVIKLAGSIRDNLPRYKRDKPWLAEAAAGSAWQLETNLAPADPLALLDPVDQDFKDVENAIRIHKALPGLTPLQARDPRLWTHLTHGDLWSYMRRRWPVEKYMTDPGKAERYVRERYFVAKNESRALLRNGASRLWWSAMLSYDSQRDNPYELTAVLFTYLDITQQILERNIGRAQAVVRGFLEFLRVNHELLEGGNANRARIRSLAKLLNLTGGVCLLDCLADTEVIGILQREYENIRTGEAKTAAR